MFIDCTHSNYYRHILHCSTLPSKRRCNHRRSPSHPLRQLKTRAACPISSRCSPHCGSRAYQWRRQRTRTTPPPESSCSATRCATATALSTLRAEEQQQQQQEKQQGQQEQSWTPCLGARAQRVVQTIDHGVPRAGQWTARAAWSGRRRWPTTVETESFPLLTARLLCCPPRHRHARP